MILDRWGRICALLGSTHNLNVYAGLAMTMSDVPDMVKKQLRSEHATMTVNLQS